MMKDLAEHTGTLIALLGVVASIAGAFFWRMMSRMENKIDHWMEEHMQCRERQIKEFVTKSEFVDWKGGRTTLWRRVHGHKHDPEGKVIITTED